MALDNIPTLGPGAFNGNLDKVLVYKNGGSEVACSLLNLTNSALNPAGIYLDTANQRVGIGTTTPTAILHLVYTSGQAVRNQRIGDSLNGAPTYENFKSGGVPNALTAVLANTNLGQYTWRGSTGATTQGLGARLQAWSLENFTTSSYGSRLDLSVTQLGTTTEVVIMNLRGSGVNIGNGTADLGARVGIVGSGSTSATTSLLVQNSSGVTGLTVFDNGNVSVGSSTNSGYQLFGNGAWFNSGSIYTPVLYASNIVPASGGSTNFYANLNNFKIGTSATATASAVFEVNSTTQGFLPPRMTTAQKNVIATPAAGLMVYDTDLNRPCFHNGSAWVTL